MGFEERERGRCVRIWWWCDTMSLIVAFSTHTKTQERKWEGREIEGIHTSI